MTTPVLIGAIVALFTTLTGALFGPEWLEYRRYRRNEMLRTRGAREGPYREFVTAVEQLQLSLDLQASGYPISRPDYLLQLRQMEEARAGIDLVGTVAARVWAYRCRLAVSGMDRILQGGQGDGATYRAKLHEARSEFVVRARAELTFAAAPQPPAVDAREDAADRHEAWLQAGATEDAKIAVLVPYAELSAWRIASAGGGRTLTVPAVD